MEGFDELPVDAQIDPIPEGFEALPDDAQLEPAQTQGLPDAQYRQQLYDMIAKGRPRQEINALIQGQGIDPAQVTGIDEAMAAARQGRGFGVHSVDGNTTANADAETAGQALYRGVGDLAAGVGDVIGLVGNPINATINAIAGTNLSTDLGESLRDLTGAPRAVTDTEQLLSTAGRGAASGLAGAGLGTIAAGAGGMTGYVGGRVAAAPLVDAISGATGGAGSEIGARAGGTPGAIVGGLVGGIGGAAAVSRLARMLPAEVALTREGRLTPDAHELALRNGVDEDDLIETYARERRATDRRMPAERQAAREAVRNRPVSSDAAYRGPNQSRLPPSASLDLPPVPTPEQMGRFSRVENVPLRQVRSTQSNMDWAPMAVRREYKTLIDGYGDLPVAVRKNDGEFLVFDGHHRSVLAARSGAQNMQMHVIDAKDFSPSNAGRKNISSGFDDDALLAELGADFPPASRPATRPVQRPDLAGANQRLTDAISERVPPVADDAAQAAPTTAQDRFDEAQSEGIRYSRGQAEQDFDVQNDENGLRVSATREGEQARGFFRQQQEQIQSAIERFRSNFGPDAGNATDRGAQVKEAVKALRDNGKEGVNQLYRQAEELGGESLVLDTKGIRDVATDVLIDEGVPEAVKKSVSQELARYGMIGKADPINEAGLTKVTLDDGSSVSFRGPVKELTAANADAMRKAINRLYLSDPTRASQSIKPAIDDALEAAIEQAAGREGLIGDAYKVARAAHREQRQTFNAKDIVENLIAVKKGTQTDVLLPDRAIAQVIGAGAEGLTNIRRVKSLLLSGGHPTSQTAWKAIQHQGLADLFDKAISRNVNHGSGQIGDVVSGAKLNSAIRTFGVEKLKELLEPEEFNGLMKLQRIIGTATIPISGTTNPSGTATKIINYLRQGTLRFAGAVPGVGGAVNAFAGLAAKGKEIAATRRTLEGITNYDGRAATSKKLDDQARDFVRDYIDSGKSGRLVPTSINLSGATQTRNDK